jgi:hypothetical protein
MNESLLAKSSIDGRPAKTLVDHTKDVMAAVGFLYGTEDQPTRLAREWALLHEDFGKQFVPSLIYLTQRADSYQAYLDASSDSTPRLG